MNARTETDLLEQDRQSGLCLADEIHMRIHKAHGICNLIQCAEEVEKDDLDNGLWAIIGFLDEMNDLTGKLHEQWRAAKAAEQSAAFVPRAA